LNQIDPSTMLRTTPEGSIMSEGKSDFPKSNLLTKRDKLKSRFVILND